MDTMTEIFADNVNKNSGIKTDTYEDTCLDDIDIPEMIEKIKANFW